MNLDPQGRMNLPRLRCRAPGPENIALKIEPRSSLNVQHLFTHVQPNKVSPQWRKLLDHLGVTNEQLQDRESAAFFYEYVMRHGGIKEANRLVDEASRLDNDTAQEEEKAEQCHEPPLHPSDASSPQEPLSPSYEDNEQLSLSLDDTWLRIQQPTPSEGNQASSTLKEQYYGVS